MEKYYPPIQRTQLKPDKVQPKNKTLGTKNEYNESFKELLQKETKKNNKKSKVSKVKKHEDSIFISEEALKKYNDQKAIQ